MFEKSEIRTDAQGVGGTMSMNADSRCEPEEMRVDQRPDGQEKMVVLHRAECGMTWRMNSLRASTDVKMQVTVIGNSLLRARARLI